MNNGHTTCMVFNPSIHLTYCQTIQIGLSVDTACPRRKKWGTVATQNGAIHTGVGNGNLEYAPSQRTRGTVVNISMHFHLTSIAIGIDGRRPQTPSSMFKRISITASVSHMLVTSL